MRDLVTQRLLARSGSRKRGGGTHLLAGIEAYATSTECRQQFLSHYFTGDAAAADRCGSCDACHSPEEVAERIAQSSDARAEKRPVEALSPEARETIVEAVGGLRRPVGKSALAKALRGSRAKALRRFGLIDLPQHGALRAVDERSIVAAVEDLIQDGRLERRGAKYPTVWLPGRPIRQQRSPAERAQRRPARSRLRRDLENYRQRQARRLKWKRYMVVTNSVIDQLEQTQPTSIWELEQIRGLGPAKIDRFGQDLIDIVSSHADGEA